MYHEKGYRSRGYEPTAEVTPHHLSLTDEAILSYNTNTKMAPPLRAARDREELRQGLASGAIDCIATDHAPHAGYEKDVEYTSAPFGIIGFQTALPLVLDLVRKERLSEIDAIARLTYQPARVLGLRAGTLEPGSAADFALVDPESVWKVEPANLLSRSTNSPFLGVEMRGRAVRTYVGGRLVHDVETELLP